VEVKKVEVEVRAGEDARPTLRFAFKVEGQFSHPQETRPVVEFLNGVLFTTDYKVISHILPFPLYSNSGNLSISLQTTNIITERSFDFPRKEEFSGNAYGIAYLDPHIIGFLDNLRNANPKKDLELIIALEFRFLYLKIERLGSHPHFQHWVSMDKVFRYEKLHIPASDWVHDFAPKLGLGEYIVVEIPKGNEVIKKAWEYVRQAEVSFRNWDDKSVSAHCREAVKIIKDYVGKQIDKGDKRKWEKLKDKINEIFAAVESLSSTGLHETEIAPIRRPDAEFILYLTKLLIRYAEQVVS